MKKFLTLSITILLCSILLTACSRNSTTPNYVPFWGQRFDSSSGEDFLEKSIFDISVKPLIENEKATNKDEYKFDPAYSSGTYTTQITSVLTDGQHTQTYKVTNSLIFTGKFNKDGNLTAEFTDKYESEAVFKITSNGISMISSARNVENATICNDDGTLDKVSYKVSNTYNGKKVSTIFTVVSDPKNLLKDNKSTKNVSTKQSIIFDNESLFYGIRALTPIEGFSASYGLFDSLQQKYSTLNASFVTLPEEDSLINLATGATINGEAKSNVTCNLIKNIITGTVNVGSPINLYYANNALVKYKLITDVIVEVQSHYLAKVEHGDMIYTLKTFTNLSMKG